MLQAQCWLINSRIRKTRTILCILERGFRFLCTTVCGEDAMKANVAEEHDFDLTAHVYSSYCLHWYCSALHIAIEGPISPWLNDESVQTDDSGTVHAESSDLFANANIVLTKSLSGLKNGLSTPQNGHMRRPAVWCRRWLIACANRSARVRQLETLGAHRLIRVAQISGTVNTSS